MYGEFDNIKICGIASAAPKTVIDNEQVAETLGNRRAKKQVALTGIKHRHVMGKGQSAADLSSVCGEKLLTELGWDQIGRASCRERV